uniref:Uncharacterized protein n=1 Tax=Arundo donax TaxID=35708 RepID=A0A0A8Y4Z9_ARUDO
MMTYLFNIWYLLQICTLVLHLMHIA